MAVGRILKASGVRGEMRVLPLTDFPERFDSLAEVFLVEKGRPARRVTVERARSQGRFAVVKLAGVEDRRTAEGFAGATLEVGLDEAVVLPKGRYYVFDIVGLEAVTEDGRSVGRVKDVLKLPAHDVYVVENEAGEEIMIPAVETIVIRVDLRTRQMVLRPLEGLIPDDAD